MIKIINYVKINNMKKIYSYIFSLSLCFNIAYAEDIRTILKEYEEASDLSNKTRTESLGHYYIITRKDLEIMQAYKLSDVLKSLKLHTFMYNNFGVRQLTSASATVGLTTSYRLYIDDHEVSSLHTDNPMLIYDEYPLDNIDHIEIYCGAGAVRLGNEPSFTIIKLYTKKPERENTSYIRTTISNKKDANFSFVDARKIKDISYLIMLNYGYINNKSQFINDKPINNDILQRFFFSSIEYQDSKLDLQFARLSRGIFRGLSINSQPDNGETISTDFYLSFTQRFLQDKSIKFNFSVDINKRKYEELNNSSGIFIQPFFNPFNPIIYYNEERTLKKYTLYLSKEFKTSNNVLLTGISAKYKENSVDKINYITWSQQNIFTDKAIPFDKWYLYSFFIENQYNINEKNLLFLSLKLDNNQRNGGYKDTTDYIVRVGYISIFNNFTFKTFATKTYIPPSFFEYEFAKEKGNLRKEDVKGISTELIYKKDSNEFKLFYGYAKAKDMIIFTPYGSINNPENNNSNFFVIDYIYKILPHYKVDLNLYKVFSEYDYSSKQGGALKLFADFDKYNFYTELIYRKGFTAFGQSVNDSFDLTVAGSINIKDNISLKIKGENLLNKAIKTPFNNGIYQNYERKIYLTTEVLF